MLDKHHTKAKKQHQNIKGEPVQKRGTVQGRVKKQRRRRRRRRKKVLQKSGITEVALNDDVVNGGHDELDLLGVGGARQMGVDLLDV